MIDTLGFGSVLSGFTKLPTKRKHVLMAQPSYHGVLITFLHVPESLQKARQVL